MFDTMRKKQNTDAPLIPRRHVKRFYWFCAIAACFLITTQGAIASRPDAEVRIGVLAYRGAEEARRMWLPTAGYLTGRIPGHRFTVVPLGFREIGPAVGDGRIDFVLSNSSIYGYTEDIIQRKRIIEDKLPFLQKPAKPKELLAKIREILDAPK